MNGDILALGLLAIGLVGWVARYVWPHVGR